MTALHAIVLIYSLLKLQKRFTCLFFNVYLLKDVNLNTDLRNNFLLRFVYLINIHKTIFVH